MDQTTKQSIIDRLNQASNVLVTVKANPDVDDLAACIGFALFLNKIDKHATAVFSGNVPSTLEFLKPEETIEKNTDSLRDFIISLDKSKADKLRYKVEDKVVKIFITPYKTSISDKDLEFGQGDFNVDVVLALGAHTKEDIDKAILAHGRILHDATIITLNNGQASNLGTLNLEDPQASSISEMAVDICETLAQDQFDTQTATALLTGIVAETKRFSNEKTTPRTMTLSAKLMAAGANQQLIATKLQPEMVASSQPDASKPKPVPHKDDKSSDGTLRIEHADDEEAAPADKAPAETDTKPADKPVEMTLPEPAPSTPASPAIQPAKSSTDQTNTPSGDQPRDPFQNSSMAFEPPQMGGTLTASSQTQTLDPAVDPLSDAATGKTLSHGKSPIDIPKPEDLKDSTLSDIEKQVNNYDTKTISTIEQDVDSPHVNAQAPPATETDAGKPDLDAAREAVESASVDSPEPPAALQSVGSQPIDLGNQPAQQPSTPPADQGNQNSSMPNFLGGDDQVTNTPPAPEPPSPAPQTPVAPAPPAVPHDEPQDLNQEQSSQPTPPSDAGQMPPSAPPPPPVPPPMMPPTQ